jgi:hypothetical protein
MATGPDLDLAAAFAFGRELLIPAMLRTIVSRIAAADADRWSPFQFYLERQIEIDEQEHGPIVRRILSRLLQAGHRSRRPRCPLNTSLA